MIPDDSLRELHGSGHWAALTTVPAKFEQYSQESYFRESWDLARQGLGADVLRALQRVALLTIKPEGVLGRKAEDCIDYMVDEGFRPVLALPFRYNGHKTREIWRWQWNIATLDRLALGDRLHASGPALAVFFVDERREKGIPGSVRLGGLKGSSLPWERHPDELRSRLGALNRMIVFVHCSDEPIDVIRELGIMFGRTRLARAYRQLSAALDGTANPGLDHWVDRLYKGTQEMTVCIESAVDSLFTSIGRQSSVDRGRWSAAQRVKEAVLAAQNGDALAWGAWSRELSKARLDISPWTAVLVATHYIQHDVPGVRCIIDDSGRERWLAGEGLVLDGG